MVYSHFSDQWLLFVLLHCNEESSILKIRDPFISIGYLSDLMLFNFILFIITTILWMDKMREGFASLNLQRRNNKWSKLTSCFIFGIVSEFCFKAKWTIRFGIVILLWMKNSQRTEELVSLLSSPLILVGWCWSDKTFIYREYSHLIIPVCFLS